MNTYNWQQSDWPHFRYDVTGLHAVLLAIAEKSGLIAGKISHLNQQQHDETLLDLIVEEAIKTSKIEGEYLSRPDVRSSIKNKLGLNPTHIKVQDQRAQGIAELMVDCRATFQQSLTETTLFKWHKMLLSHASRSKLKIASWRTHSEPMQIISGAFGKLKIHYEAPPSHHVPNEMKKFIRWFNETAPGKTQAIPFAPVRAAIAHLYFESIHPFEDGNGRIGRAIAEKALSQGLGYPAILSLSHAIEADKKAYYSALHQASLSNEVTPWIHYFVNIILTAQHDVETQLNFILKKTNFFDRLGDQCNERQLKVLRRMLESPKGFEGGISAKKYMSITHTSKATATRDLQHLFSMTAIKQIGHGRNVRYEINFQ